MDSAPLRVVASPAGPSPPRRPNSIRRTSSIDSDWPNGWGEPFRLRGDARDAVTGPSGALSVVAEGSYQIISSPKREILAIETSPDRKQAKALIGARGGGHLRGALGRHFADDRAGGHPLYLILDDFSGASLVAGWVWSRWRPDWMKQARKEGVASTAGKNGVMEGVCIGFRPGSSALTSDGTSAETQSSARVPSLVRPDDPLGWHALREQEGVGMRRARRIDVWIDDAIRVEAAFQDSGTSPDGGRVAVHEYLLTATIDVATTKLLDVAADARILPFPECPSGVANVRRMVGTPISAMREQVLTELRGTLGCTHLNDVLRSLAEVPQLVTALKRAG